MKKRFFPILFVFLMVFSSTAYAASTRAAAVVPRISFNGTTASCTVFIAADRPTDDIEAVIKLWQGSKCIETWEESSIGDLAFSGTATVSRGKTYQLTVDVIEINQQILNAISANTRSTDWSEITSLMPATSDSTVAAGETAQEDSAVSETRSSSYDTAEVVTYASTWWNKTNNTDYPYYAEYNGMDTSRNDYNSLDSGRSGQSNPARGRSDCADFVSQCLAAGGVPQIKSGLILPHQKTGNWYYNDDKPSHTWGGASNFYNHWKERVGVASSSANLGVGDAVSIDFGGDGSPDHTVIIVSAGSTDSSKYLASHTTDRYMYYYSNGTLNPFTGSSACCIW